MGVVLVVWELVLVVVVMVVRGSVVSPCCFVRGVLGPEQIVEA